MMPCYTDDTSDDVIYLYYEEPKVFIPESVFEWYEEYEYYKEFNGAPNFNEVSSRFIEMKNTYNGYLSFWDKPRANNEGYS
jgi:hypothetical protein